MNLSNPSVEGDTPFKSSTSTNEIFAQDITNEPKSSLVTDIMEQIHFNTWKEIDDIYAKLKNDENEGVCNASTCDLHKI